MALSVLNFFWPKHGSSTTTLSMKRILHENFLRHVPNQIQTRIHTSQISREIESQKVKKNNNNRHKNMNNVWRVLSAFFSSENESAERKGKKRR